VVEGKLPDRLQLFDSFELLTWAGIVEAITVNGDPVQIHGRGYEVDRVKVLNHEKLVSDIKVGHLLVRNQPFDFISKYIRHCCVALEIGPDLFITTRHIWKTVRTRRISFSDSEINEFRRAIAADINSLSNDVPNKLPLYVQRVNEYCISWNTGDAARLRASTEKLTAYQSAPWFMRLSEAMYRWMRIFMNSYLANKNIPAAAAILQKAEGTRQYGAMSERLAKGINTRISELLGKEEISRAREMANWIPNEIWKEQAYRKIDDASYALKADLEKEFVTALHALDIPRANGALERGRAASIERFQGANIAKLHEYLGLVDQITEGGANEFLELLGSSIISLDLRRGLQCLIRKRMHSSIKSALEKNEYAHALGAAKKATELDFASEEEYALWDEACKKTSEEMEYLVRKLERREKERTIAIERLTHCAAAARQFGLNTSILTTSVDSEMSNVIKELRNRNIEAKQALGVLNELLPISGYAPSEIPFKALRNFLKCILSMNLTRANILIHQLEGAEVPSQRLIDEATKRAATRTEKLLESGRYLKARKFFVERRKHIGSDEPMRRRLLSAFCAARRQKELDFFRTEIYDALKQIFSGDKCLKFSQPHLSHEDFLLIAHWNGRIVDSLDGDPLDELVRLVGPYVAIQHFAARSAELVALRLYDDIENGATDLSAQQLSGRAGLWRLADIKTPDRLIDVKSARSSFGRRDRFSEYYVKRFKGTGTGTDVHISTFFSQYRTLEQIKRHDHSWYLWVGEISEEKLDDMFWFIERNFGSILSLDDFRSTVSEKRFIPGWLFDYPKPVYKDRDNAVRSLRSLLERGRLRDALPIGLRECVHILGLDERLQKSGSAERLIINALSAMVKQVGLDRGLLFMTVLSVSLTAARRKLQDFHPGLFRKYLFLDYTDKAKLRPLGVDDPFGYIAELIECLDVIFEKSSHQLLEFSRFRLVGHGILLGKSPIDGEWTTILAYCGGRDQEVNVTCGNTPLVLGRHSNCTTCRKLICTECGFCSAGCPKCYSAERRASTASRLPVDTNDWRHNFDSDIPF